MSSKGPVLRKSASSEGPIRKQLTKTESQLGSGTGPFDPDPVLTPVTFLKKRQRKYVVITWLAVKERTKFGLAVYARVFQRQPQLTGLFPSLHGGSPRDVTELEKNPSFRCQAAAFSSFLDYVVSFVHLDAGNFISEASYQIGRRHAERLKSIDVMPEEWWDAFTASTLHCLKAYFPSSDGVASRVPFVRRVMGRSYCRAWEKVMQVLTNCMKEGFRDYKEHERALSRENGTSRVRVPISPYQTQWKKMADHAGLGKAKRGGLVEDDQASIDSDDTSSTSSSG